MIEEAAGRYADGFTSAEELAELARRRLAQRVRRASHGTCPVCGKPLWGRADQEVCSDACRAKRHRVNARLGPPPG